MYIRIMRDADPATASLGPSLSDILPDESKSEWNNEPKLPITPAATEKVSDLATAINTQQDVPKEVPAQAAQTPEKTEGDAGQGLGEGEAAQDEAPEEAGEATPEAFFEAVNQLTGEPVDVEYGEVDPLTPQGIALRDQAIRADEVTKFEDHIKQSDPRAYAYFMHRQQGGDDASFFEQQTVSLPEVSAFQASVELQTRYYKQSLIDRGLDADIAEAQVAAAIKNNTLETKAMAVYNATRSAQVNQLAQMERLAAQEKQQYENACNTVLTNLNSAIDTGSLKFIIPEAGKAGFKAFVQSSLRHEEGKFFAVQEINGSPAQVLESLYFAYMKGNLESLIEKSASTKAVQRLKLGVQKAMGGLPTGTQAAKKRNDFVSLGDI